MSLKRGRDSWEKLVDGTGEVAENEDIKEYIQSRQANYDAAKTTFHPQMTPEEACHAQPLKSNVTDNFFHSGEVAPGTEREGPNFLKDFAPLLQQNHTNMAPSRVHFSNREALAATLAPSASNVIKQRADFIPIILVPSTASSILQIWNIQEFVERGRFTDAHKRFMNEEDGSTTRRDSEESVIAGPGNLIDFDTYRVKFRNFKFVDSAKHVDNWDHVCACVVTGNKWQFEDWFPNDKSQTDPSVLFKRVRGFYPFFEEDKPAPQKDQWSVVPVQLTRKTTKSSTLHLRAASIFWEEIYKFLDSNERFRTYSLPTGF